MTLGLTEEHLQLAETVRGWAQRHCPADVVRAAADGPDSGSALYRESLAPGLAEQGVLGLHVPDEDGGQGYGLPELAVAVEELGRALVPGAFLPTVLASAALVAAGITGKLVTGLADGSKTGAVGLAAGLTGSPDAAGGLIIEGESGPVLGASLADLVILPVQTDGGEMGLVLRLGFEEFNRGLAIGHEQALDEFPLFGIEPVFVGFQIGFDLAAFQFLDAIERPGHFRVDGLFRGVNGKAKQGADCVHVFCFRWRVREKDAAVGDGLLPFVIVDVGECEPVELHRAHFGGFFFLV